ncbi:MAG TPA: CPBP family intramembrane glutamic endopeptidase [Gemmatimonadaceae bacterium]
MPAVRDLWSRIPVPIRALVLGLLAAAAGTYPWAWLAGTNLRVLPSVPWGPAVMAVYLWLYWRYATGRGWPASTSVARRDHARVRPVDGSVWPLALVAGIVGLWCSVSLLRLIGRFVAISSPATGDVARLSPLTLLAFALMGALVAGVAEEIGFRGYMQRPLEQRYGPVAAILIVGVVFGLAHGSHTYWTLALMPYYLAVAAVYGALAYLTNSIIPSLVLHAGGDALDALMSLGGGGSVVQQAAAPHAGVGAGTAVAINLVVLAATGLASIWACRELAKATHRPFTPAARAVT